MAEAADFPGTRPTPARRWLRRTAALLVGTPLLAGLLQAPVSPAADAAVPGTPTTAATDSGPVDVSLDELTPAAPREGDTVTVSGTVTNNGKQTVTGGRSGCVSGHP
ncbi:hypothetical protein SALBM135S_03393 [Streptomyces alboniger]